MFTILITALTIGTSTLTHVTPIATRSPGDSLMCLGNSTPTGCSTPTGITSGMPLRTIGDGLSTTFWQRLRWPPFVALATWTWKPAVQPEHPITPWFGRNSTMAVIRARIRYYRDSGGVRASGGGGRHGGLNGNG